MANLPTHMANPGRLLYSLRLFRPVCAECHQRVAQRIYTLQTSERFFTSTTNIRADASVDNKTAANLDALVGSFAKSEDISKPNRLKKGGSLSYKPPPKPHHLHIYATRHNCHITLTTGNRDALISVSAGNLNFRKAARGTYDAAFQLGAFVMAKMKNMGLLDERYAGKGGPIESLEVLLRDFGPGREAITRVLLGQEGKEVKPRITRIMDSTRVKFGGTRSRKPRRLG